jgi:hypothetical protein
MRDRLLNLRQDKCARNTNDPTGQEHGSISVQLVRGVV